MAKIIKLTRSRPKTQTELRVAHHIWDIPACFFDAEFAKGVYIPAVLFQMGAFFAKTSILLLFHQLFNVQRPIRISIWVGHVFNFMLYAVGIAVATYFETPRIGEQWTDTLDGRTLVPVPWWQLQSALTVLLDLYIFVLPLPVLAKLSLPMKRKLGLTAVFSLALRWVLLSYHLFQRASFPGMRSCKITQIHELTLDCVAFE